MGNAGSPSNLIRVKGSRVPQVGGFFLSKSYYFLDKQITAINALKEIIKDNALKTVMLSPPVLRGTDSGYQ